MTTVSDVIRLMESIAPRYLAEGWDNPGLQVGRMDWEVTAVRVALDPTPQVVSASCTDQIDLLITHHPLIFKPLTSLNLSSYPASVIQTAIEHRLAIFSAHTNLDSVKGGVNDMLAQKLGLKHIRVLTPLSQPDLYKLTVYVPVDYEIKLLNALFETSAGTIGEYANCSFRNRGTGTFKPSSAANPFIGKANEVSHVDEVRIEAVVPKQHVESVIAHLKKAHPYETMAYDVYPLLNEEYQGIGRIGETDGAIDLISFARRVKEQLNAGEIRMAGNPNLLVRRVAVCGGSGSSLMKDFIASGADVYVSGDLHYHNARDAEIFGRGLIDVGHFASEQFIVEILAERLRTAFSQTSTDVRVEVCSLEQEPFFRI